MSLLFSHRGGFHAIRPVYPAALFFRHAFRRAGSPFLFLLLTLASLTAGTARAAQAAQDAQAPVTPHRGEVALEGTVAVQPSDWAAPEANLTLRVERLVSPSGDITTLDPPRQKIVRLSPATQLRFPDPKRTAVRADLDYGAVLTIVGTDKGAGTALNARAIEVMTTAGAAMGENLLPATGDPKSWHGHLEPNVTDGSIDPDPQDPGVIVAHVRRSDKKIPWHAQVSLRPVLKEGKTYTLWFRARAATPHPILVDSSSTPLAYNNIGLHQTINVDPVWRPFRITFTANSLKGSTMLVVPSFLLGLRTGDVWFADVAIAEGNHPLPASARPSPAIGTSLLFHTTDPDCWTLLNVDPASSTVDSENGALRIKVTRSGDKGEASVQLYQVTDLEVGRSYRLRFRARADAKRQMGVATMEDRGDYHTTGLKQRFEAGPEGKFFEFTFTPTDADPGQVRVPTFGVGADPGTYWLSEISLVPLGPPPPATTTAP